MTTEVIKEKVHHFIDAIGEKKAAAIYTLFEDEIADSENFSLAQYNQDLDEAEAEFAAGEFVTHEEMIAQINKK
jgi:predicted transcriptional regulator